MRQHRIGFVTEWFWHSCWRPEIAGERAAIPPIVILDGSLTIQSAVPLERISRGWRKEGASEGGRRDHQGGGDHQ